MLVVYEGTRTSTFTARTRAGVATTEWESARGAAQWELIGAQHFLNVPTWKLTSGLSSATMNVLRVAFRTLSLTVVPAWCFSIARVATLRELVESGGAQDLDGMQAPWVEHLLQLFAFESCSQVLLVVFMALSSALVCAGHLLTTRLLAPFPSFTVDPFGTGSGQLMPT